MTSAISLAAMEAELKPKVLEQDLRHRIADTYKKLRKLQDKQLEVLTEGARQRALAPLTQKRLRGSCATSSSAHREVDSRSTMRASMRLVEQLYEINKRLVGFEGKLMRLADLLRRRPQDFLDEYFGNELDPTGSSRVEALWRRAGRSSATGRAPATSTRA